MKDNTKWARLCHACRSAPSTVYCRVDSAYLCTGCDTRIHAPNQLASCHERVWVCESCERAPSAFICKADSASLCTSCDADIHSANPLARRHHRVPVEPLPGCLYGPQTTDPGGTVDGFMNQQERNEQQTFDEEDEEEAASWLLTNPVKNGNNQINGFLFGGEQDDEYLDLMDHYDSNSQEDNQFSDQFGQEQYSVSQKSYRGDSVVPVQSVQGQIQQQLMFQLGLELDSPKAAYSYNGSTSSNVSSIDVGVVPNPTMSDNSISDSRPVTKETIDFFSGGHTTNQMPTQLSPKDREARVLRYREKKKTRKFEKTIRYASRKAYAETRPRIKGRFAKRTCLEQVEVDQMFSSTLMTETGYGIVPSFETGY